MATYTPQNPDDAAFTVGSQIVSPIGGLADEAATDSVDEGDVGALRMTLDRKLLTRVVGSTDANRLEVSAAGAASENLAQVAGNSVTAGAGSVAAGTQRVTLASDDPAVASLGIIDDWDESDRAKVNPIAGQAGVQGGSGTTNALTQRVVLATDVALPTGTNSIGKISDITTSVTPGTANDNLGKRAGDSSSGTDVGVMALGVSATGYGPIPIGSDGSDFIPVGGYDGANPHGIPISQHSDHPALSIPSILVSENYSNVSDSFSTTGNGTSISFTSSCSNISIQVIPTGAVTSWTVIVEGSLDGFVYGTLTQHTNVSGSGAIVSASIGPLRNIRMRCSAIVLGAGTDIQCFLFVA